MSSEFMFDEPFYPHLALPPEMLELSSNFFSDSSIDTIFQEFPSDDHNPAGSGPPMGPQISADEAQSLDQIAHTLLSSSPPSQQLQTLTISHQQQTQLGNLADSCDFSSGLVQHSVSDVKTEEFTGVNHSYFMDCDQIENDHNLLKLMQRSYSSNSFEGKQTFFFQPQFDAFLENQGNFQGNEIDSINGCQMRRVCSTGDLPEVRMSQMGQQREGNMNEEGNFKVGRYNAEERREKIDRYRAKRTQRNFNKTIKYACRKTLADNRPRIRGRFARNDETGEIPKPTSNFHPYDQDDDDHWVDNPQEDDDEGILGREGGRFLTNFGGPHFRYCGY